MEQLPFDKDHPILTCPIEDFTDVMIQATQDRIGLCTDLLTELEKPQPNWRMVSELSIINWPLANHMMYRLKTLANLTQKPTTEEGKRIIDTKQ